MAQDFLVEIGTEELPPTALKSLSRAFFNHVTSSLSKLDLKFAGAEPFATPRRLAIVIRELDDKTPSKQQKVWGAPAKVAFNEDGSPGKAAQAFAKKNGISVDALAVENDGKQDKLVYLATSGGETTVSLLASIVEDALVSLPIPKKMRWGSSREEFVRPIKWVTMLFGDKVIDCEILGIASSRTTRGHRFHSKGEFDVATPSTYATQLKQQGHVIASFAERQQMIVDQVSAEAHKFSGHAEIDPELLDEVTGLVEWPTALCGQFEDSFLEVPSEALISSMKEHQKYFHLLDSEGNLMPRFITVSNIISKNPAQVIDGNERVIRPRLADAKFFFETDKQTSLEARIEKLKSLVFQAKLGSVFDKTQRIKAIAGFIAKTLDLPSDQLSLIARAADLCKSDLVTNMVYEFTDLQGLAGYHYALNDGESESVALAMQEQYLPKFAGDAVPSSDVGALIAIADRLDTIVGIFGLGQKPTGSKDPFGLRRASLGVLRILVERDYDLDLKDLVAFAKDQFADLPKRDEVETNVLGYMLDRFKSWYSDEGISAETFMAVFAKNITVPKDFNTRIFAVSDFSNLPESASLASGKQACLQYSG